MCSDRWCAGERKTIQTRSRWVASRPRSGFKLPAANSRSWVLGKVREQTEICIRWNYLRSSAGFLRIDCKKRNKIKKIQPESIKLKQKLAKREGWGAKKGAKGRQRAPKVSQRAPKVNQKGGKKRQRWAKSSPRETKGKPKGGKRPIKLHPKTGKNTKFRKTL